MVRLQMVVAVVVLCVCCSSAEARGRRMMRQPVYTQNYNTAAPTNMIVQQSPTTQQVVVQQAAVPQTSGVVQTSGISTGQIVVPANAVAAGTAQAVAKGSVVGSAQWKAEQSARMGSVQHIGGGFGGGSYEGNGFGATPEQAIQGSCFWGQRTPIEIGVARGANGYYATIFYR